MQGRVLEFLYFRNLPVANVVSVAS
jgi:hypothetical protein